MKKRYPYYPGCSLHSTGREYDLSFREICPEFGIELEEVKGWTCCGASSAHPVSHLLSIALPAGNLARVEASGSKEVLVPCAACFSRFKTTANEIKNEPAIKPEIDGVLGRPFLNSVETIHPLGLLDELIKNGGYDNTCVGAVTKHGVPQTAKKPAKDMSGIKTVCYYGCLLTRPPKVTQFDDCEYPMTMDRVLRKFGIETLDWSYKTDCCGAGFGLTRPDIVCKLIKKILDNAIAVGANAVAVACPLCHANLDSRQADLNAEGGNYNIPIFYFTQLIGLAMGISPERLGLKSHLVETGAALEMMK